jgi:hypothetical protein
MIVEGDLYFELSEWTNFQFTLAFTSTNEADSTIVQQLFNNYSTTIPPPFHHIQHPSATICLRLL